MNAIVEELKKNGKPGDTDKMASILEATNVEKPRWIADELWQQLLISQQKLKYDDYVEFEGRYIIHREFGHGKRLSEMEKRLLSKIVMDRTQCTKNIYMKYIQRIRRDGDLQLVDADAKEDNARAMAMELNAYLKENMGKLNTKVKDHAGQSTSGLFLDLPPFEHLGKELEGIMSIFSGSMLAKEQLQLEKSRTMRKVNIEERPDTKLHDELEDAIKRYAQDLVNAQRAALQVEKDIAQVRVSLYYFNHHSSYGIVSDICHSNMVKITDASKHFPWLIFYIMIDS